jgi:hypothetical protein
MDDGVGRGKVEADAAGFETNEEDRDRIIVLEPVDLSLSVFRKPGEITMARAAFFKTLPDEIEHFDELAEDKDTMAAVDDLLEQFVEKVEFGGSVAALVRRKSEQSEIATDLTEPKQTGQHFHPHWAVVRSARSETLLNLAQERIVGRALGRTQFARDDLLDLFRQLAGHVGFAAAKEKRANPAGKATLQRRRGIAGERLLVTLAKVGPGPEITGRDEIHERPEIADRVFHRGAGENETPLRTKAAGGLGILRLRVLDVLGFVEHDRAQFEASVEFHVAPQEAITR